MSAQASLTHREILFVATRKKEMIQNVRSVESYTYIEINCTLYNIKIKCMGRLSPLILHLKARRGYCCRCGCFSWQVANAFMEEEKRRNFMALLAPRSNIYPAENIFCNHEIELQIKSTNEYNSHIQTAAACCLATRGSHYPINHRHRHHRCRSTLLIRRRSHTIILHICIQFTPHAIYSNMYRRLTSVTLTH